MPSYGSRDGNRKTSACRQRQTLACNNNTDRQITVISHALLSKFSFNQQGSRQSRRTHCHGGGSLRARYKRCLNIQLEKEKKRKILNKKEEINDNEKLQVKRVKLMQKGQRKLQFLSEGNAIFLGGEGLCL